MKDARVLVTGASGFVGSAVARGAAARGAQVRVLVRRTSPRENFADFPCEIAEGDMRDAASVARAMDGVRYLFHVAADYRLWARDPNEIITNNREGTRIVMEAARAAGVERMVYTSSVATLKPHDDGSDADESDRADMTTAIGAYKKSKVAAERVVEEFAAKGLPVVLVSPSTPIGPRDIRPTPTGRIIVEAATRAHAGLCRYGPQPRPCRRCGGRPFAGAGQGPHRRDLYPRRAEREPAPKCWR